MSNFRCPALLRLARDQACMNCGIEDGTIVSAHSNSSTHGKGKSLKSHDCFIAFLCHRCHGWLDQGTGEDPTKTWRAYVLGDKTEMFRKAMDKTTLHLWASGKIKVR